MRGGRCQGQGQAALHLLTLVDAVVEKWTMVMRKANLGCQMVKNED